MSISESHQQLCVAITDTLNSALMVVTITMIIPAVLLACWSFYCCYQLHKLSRIKE